jgi:hypothetical protein
MTQVYKEKEGKGTANTAAAAATTLLSWMVGGVGASVTESRANTR